MAKILKNQQDIITAILDPKINNLGSVGLAMVAAAKSK